MASSLPRYCLRSAHARILKERNQMEEKSSIVITTNAGGDLHENLIMEILSWLPVKWLLQLKSVCKLWYAIISSPEFISKHLKNYNHNNKHNNGTCLLTQYFATHAELQLFLLLVDDGTPRVLADEVLYNVPMYSSFVYGPCHGIYYIYYYDFSRRALWNPVTNELKVLPPIFTKPDLCYAHMDVYGFGFDPLSDDYKVVVLKACVPKDDDDEFTYCYPHSVIVYSLRADSWRHCGELTKSYKLENNKCYVFVNGCSYWLGSCTPNEVIICFDFGAEACSELCVPNYDKPALNTIGVYRDSVAFFSAGNETDKKFNIWTFNDEGFWTKVFTMGPIANLRIPVGHWEDDKVVLELQLQDLKLFLCDTNTRELWDLEFRDNKSCNGVYAYRESLVSLKDFISVDLKPEAVINGDLQDG